MTETRDYRPRSGVEIMTEALEKLEQNENPEGQMRVLGLFASYQVLELHDTGNTEEFGRFLVRLRNKVATGLDKPYALRLDGIFHVLYSADEWAPRRITEQQYRVFKLVRDNQDTVPPTMESLGLNEKDIDGFGITARSFGSSTNAYVEITPRGLGEIKAYERLQEINQENA